MTDKHKDAVADFRALIGAAQYQKAYNLYDQRRELGLELRIGELIEIYSLFRKHLRVKQANQFKDIVSELLLSKLYEEERKRIRDEQGNIEKDPEEEGYSLFEALMRTGEYQRAYELVIREPDLLMCMQSGSIPAYYHDFNTHLGQDEAVRFQDLARKSLNRVIDDAPVISSMDRLLRFMNDPGAQDSLGDENPEPD